MPGFLAFAHAVAGARVLAVGAEAAAVRGFCFFHLGQQHWDVHADVGQAIGLDGHEVDTLPGVRGGDFLDDPETGHVTETGSRFAAGVGRLG